MVWSTRQTGIWLSHCLLVMTERAPSSESLSGEKIACNKILNNPNKFTNSLGFSISLVVSLTILHLRKDYLQINECWSPGTDDQVVEWHHYLHNTWVLRDKLRERWEFKGTATISEAKLKTGSREISWEGAEGPVSCQYFSEVRLEMKHKTAHCFLLGCAT